jgi:hypothetical protein
MTQALYAHMNNKRKKKPYPPKKSNLTEEDYFKLTNNRKI